MTRTSRTDPLRIDAVAVGPPPAASRIGMTICPGKQGESVHGTAWRRDLEEDLDTISAWGADSLLTLLEPAEFAALGVSELPARARRSLRWHHAPIPDVYVPGAAFEAAWPEVSHALHRLLDEDGSIVIHCRGGLGRAGLVAALLLIERGVAAETAIAWVRVARPGAIETPAQENWLHARAADLRNKPALRRAALLGGACGDSLGGEVEFLPLAAICAQNPTGLADLACFEASEGEVTDDTQMSLFTMEGLVHARAAGTNPVVEVHRALLRWLRTQGETPQIADTGEEGLIQDRRLWRRRAPGLTCVGALAAA
jgi:protein-tyrosine phosphatase